MNNMPWRTWWLVLGICGAASVIARAEEAAPQTGPEVSVTPIANYVSVEGNEGRFREDWWLKDGWTGGIEKARLYQAFGDDAGLEVTGRGIFESEEYELKLDLTRKECGFLRAGFEQFRHYYDDQGGFFEGFSVPSFDLDSDLHLDIGRMYVELGITLPNLPKVVVGYERQYKHGEKSLLEWGPVTEGILQRNIYPAFKNIDETTDIVKVEVTHDLGNVHLDNRFQYERYQTDTDRFDTSLNLTTATTKTVTIHEDYDHDSFLNTFHMDSHVNEKLYWSLGYLFNDLAGEAGLNVMTPPPLLPFDRNWATRVVDLDLDSHVVNLNALTGPFAGLSFYGGLQAEKTDSDGFTDAMLTQGLGPATQNIIHTSNDKLSLQENLGVRYTKIPFTTLYAEGQWTEQAIDLDERETEDAVLSFQRQSDADIFRQRYSAGFNTAPLRRINLAGRYRHSLHENDYDHDVDTAAGYPAFINAQDFTSDEVMGKLTVRPFSKVSLSLTYQLVATDIDTTTQAVPLLAPGGSLQSGNYDANIYSLSVTLTPIQRLYLMGLVSYQDTRTSAADNGAASVVTYEGDVYTILGALGYALTESTDLGAEYTFYRSDNFNSNAAAGLPLGLDNESHAGVVSLSQKITEHIIARLRYGIYYYNENSNGGVADYTAQLAAVSCTIRY